MQTSHVTLYTFEQISTNYNLIFLCFMLGDDFAYIVCVGAQPRIQYCGDGTVFDPQVLTCVYVDPPHGGGAPHFGGPF